MANTDITQSTRVRKIASAAWLLCVAVLTLEFAARIDDWVHFDAPLIGNYDFDQLFRVTDRGIRGVPNGRYLRWRLNADGLNGPEIRPNAGQTRVIVYGASESFGIYEDVGKEFPRALEAELNAQTASVQYEVVNAGIPGMRVGSGISYLRELSERLHPRVVVIYPTPTHYIGVTRPYCGRPSRTMMPAGWHLPELRVAGKFKDQMKRVLPMTAMTWLRKVSITWQTRGQDLLTQVAPASLDAFEVDLTCAVTAAREANMVPILVTHANRFGDTGGDRNDGWLTGWRQQYPEMREEGFIDLERRANAAVRKIAEQEGVLLVDAAAALGGRTEWFADHAHFNNEGAAKMAALLAQPVLAAATNARTQ